MLSPLFCRLWHVVFPGPSCGGEAALVGTHVALMWHWVYSVGCHVLPLPSVVPWVVMMYYSRPVTVTVLALVPCVWWHGGAPDVDRMVEDPCRHEICGTQLPWCSVSS